MKHNSRNLYTYFESTQINVLWKHILIKENHIILHSLLVGDLYKLLIFVHTFFPFGRMELRLGTSRAKPKRHGFRIWLCYTTTTLIFIYKFSFGRIGPGNGTSRARCCSAIYKLPLVYITNHNTIKIFVNKWMGICTNI